MSIFNLLFILLLIINGVLTILIKHKPCKPPITPINNMGDMLNLIQKENNNENQ